MRKLRAFKSPYTDSNGRQIWHGMKLRGIIAEYRVKYINGVWYAYDTTGAYMNDRNRYKLLATCTGLPISDDTVVLK